MVVQQRSRSRASTGPLLHYKTGKVITRRITQDTRNIIVRVFSRRDYAVAAYVAKLLDLNEGATISRFKELREDDVKILRLCATQERSAGARMTGYLYYRLHDEGFAILGDAGIHREPREDDPHESHNITRDLVMLSHEIGVKEDGDLELNYRDDLPKSYELQKVNGKRRFMVPDEPPFTLRSKKTGAERHIAGIEIESGANGIARKDADRAAAVQKFKRIIWLIKSGELERTHRFGKQFYWEIVFRTEIRMRSAMEYLAEQTENDKDLRKHFLFKRHPFFGKSADKPRATGHMLTEPWQRVQFPPLYLDGGKRAGQQTTRETEGTARPQGTNRR